MALLFGDDDYVSDNGLGHMFDDEFPERVALMEQEVLVLKERLRQRELAELRAQGYDVEDELVSPNAEPEAQHLVSVDEDAHDSEGDVDEVGSACGPASDAELEDEAEQATYDDPDLECEAGYRYVSQDEMVAKSDILDILNDVDGTDEWKLAAIRQVCRIDVAEQVSDDDDDDDSQSDCSEGGSELGLRRESESPYKTASPVASPAPAPAASPVRVAPLAPPPPPAQPQLKIKAKAPVTPKARPATARKSVPSSSAGAPVSSGPAAALPTPVTTPSPPVAAKKRKAQILWTDEERAFVRAQLEIIPDKSEKRFTTVAERLNAKFDYPARTGRPDAARTGSMVKMVTQRRVRVDMIADGHDDRNPRKDGKARDAITSARPNKKDPAAAATTKTKTGKTTSTKSAASGTKKTGTTKAANTKKRARSDEHDEDLSFGVAFGPSTPAAKRARTTNNSMADSAFAPSSAPAARPVSAPAALPPSAVGHHSRVGGKFVPGYNDHLAASSNTPIDGARGVGFAGKYPPGSRNGGKTVPRKAALGNTYGGYHFGGKTVIPSTGPGGGDSGDEDEIDEAFGNQEDCFDEADDEDDEDYDDER